MKAWRVAAVVLVAGVVPQCTCAPPCSNHSAPHATFEVAKGCAGYYCGMNCDVGFIDCNGSEADGCETTESVPNGTVTHVGIVNSPCTVVCTSGRFDCDGNIDNGCESTTSCVFGDASTEPKTAHSIADLLGAPHGLVACAGKEFFFDGSDLISIDSSTLSTFHVLTSSAPPADGLACDGAFVYWAALATSDASANGFVYRTPIAAPNEQVFAAAIDPSSGIDVRDGGVYLMTSSGLAHISAADAGTTTWMAASPSGAYKPFALGSGEDWSISGDSILMRKPDASASTWLADAGTPRAVFVNGSGDPIVVSRASDAGDLLALVRDDAGAATFAPMDGGVHPVVATSGGASAVVASDDAIYLVGAGGATQLFTSSDHIVDVTVDGPWVVWTTRAPAHVWRGALP